MNVYYDHLSKEMNIALRAASYLEAAIGNLDNLNYGNARSWIEEARGLLPFDSDEGGIVWDVHRLADDLKREDPRMIEVRDAP